LTIRHTFAKHRRYSFLLACWLVGGGAQTISHVKIFFLPLYFANNYYYQAADGGSRKVRKTISVLWKSAVLQKGVKMKDLQKAIHECDAIRESLRTVYVALNHSKKAVVCGLNIAECEHSTSNVGDKLACIYIGDCPHKQYQ
jgi:hypothetical protein